MKKICVFGATGLLGQPVAIELLNAGFEVTAMVRNPEKARQMLPPQIKLVAGDLSDAAAIEKALQGIEAIYLNLSIKPEDKPTAFLAEREGLNQVLIAAKKLAIKRVAYCSSLVQRYQGMNGFHWWIFDVKQQAISSIKKSGIPYTIFYPSNFMDNFTRGNYRQGKRIALAGQSVYPMYFIAASDYGKQVARSFAILGEENKEYVIQGPEPLRAEKAAEIFVENYSREKLAIASLPVGLLKFLGLFVGKISYGAKIVEALNNYPEKFEAGNTWKELGEPRTTLRDFAKNT